MAIKAMRTTDPQGNFPLPATLEFSAGAIGATATKVALDRTEMVRLCVDASSWVKISALTTDATVTVGGGTYLPANAAEYFPCYNATGMFLSWISATGGTGLISIGKAI